MNIVPHWGWGLSTALILCVVIWLNGHHYRFGWILGAVVQFINMGFGWWLHGQWTFVFLTLPAGMFLWIWWRSGPRRVKKPGPFGRPGFLARVAYAPFRRLQQHAK